MAIRPEKIIEKTKLAASVKKTNKLTEREQQILKLEQVIDAEMLKSGDDVQNNTPVLIKIGSNISSEIKELLVKRYQSQGWTVEVIQARGGECIKFTPSKNVAKVIEEAFSEITSRAQKFLKRFNHEHN